MGVGTFLDLGGEDYDVPLTAGSLLEAVEESDEGKAEWLLRSGVVVDAFGAEGQTALIRAIDRRDPGMARLLLDAGASPKARCDHGRPVSFYASERGVDWLLAEVLAAGAGRGVGLASSEGRGAGDHGLGADGFEDAAAVAGVGCGCGG